MNNVLDISWGTIVKLSLAAVVVYVVFTIRELLVLLLFSVIISIVFEPAIEFLQRRKIPRIAAALLLYGLVFGAIGFTVYQTAPLFIEEVQRFATFLPEYFAALAPALANLGIAAFADLDTFLDALTRDVEQHSANILRALGAIFGGLFSTLFVISIAVFLSLEERSIERSLRLLFPRRYEAMIAEIWRQSKRKVAGWFLSRVVSSIFVGAATYLSLVLFDVSYSIILGLIAGILNFIPIIGPLITAVIIGLVVAFDPETFAEFGVDYLRTAFVLVAFTLIQQIESYVLLPLLTSRFIGMSPVLVLVALAVGMQLWGLVGAILAIPLLGLIVEFLRDFLQRKRETEEAAERPSSAL